jgi:hypothetical protein
MVDPRLKKRLLHSLIAVVAGNAVYFTVVEWLPPAARHQPFQIDWGLAVDAWFCLVCYALLGMTRWSRGR